MLGVINHEYIYPNELNYCTAELSEINVICINNEFDKIAIDWYNQRMARGPIDFRLVE